MRPIRTPRDLGLAIRRARADRGWTQADLADRANVGRPWLSELEGGKAQVVAFDCECRRDLADEAAGV